MPDVVGAQEFCKDWYKYFTPMLNDIGYKIIKERYSLFTENRTPIIYNANVLDVLDHGIHKYSKGDKNGCRSVTWALFKRKTDAKKFIVTSTHFNLIRDGKIEKEFDIMQTQANEMFEVIDNLIEKEACPVIITGDYNCMERESKASQGHYYGDISSVYAATDIYQMVADKYADSKYVAGINRYDKGGGEILTSGWDSPTWDHIFYTGDISVGSFAILSSLYFERYPDRTSRISDHLPIFADFQWST